MSSALTKKDEMTPEMVRACELIATGMTQGDVCKALNINNYRLSQWKQLPAFDDAWGRARASTFDAMADDLTQVTDSTKFPDVNRARLWADNVKWVLARRDRRNYGDKVEIDINQTVDIGAALAEAKARALPAIRQRDDVIDVECVDVTPDSGDGPRDKQSLAPPDGPLQDVDPFS